MRPETFFRWLKLGAAVNLGLIAATATRHGEAVLPAQVLLAVSAYRCLFPVRYEDNVVLHDSRLSSILVTRSLATFAEVAYIWLFALALRRLGGGSAWVGALSWLMVMQVVICQLLVWAAVLSGRRWLYFFEESGWAVIFACNTAASLLLVSSAHGRAATLVGLNLVFGAFYLPWQALHLASLQRAARRAPVAPAQTLRSGLQRAASVKNRRIDAASWGGGLGFTWMTAYWATLIPAWVGYVAIVLSEP